MAQAIVYCDRCGRLIPPSDVDRGVSLTTPGGAICAACASSLTPDQRAALQGQRPPDRPAQRPSTRIARAPAGAGEPGAAAVPAPVVSHHSTVLLLAGLGAGILAGVAVALTLTRAGTETQVESTAPDAASPAAGPVPRVPVAPTSAAVAAAPAPAAEAPASTVADAPAPARPPAQLRMDAVRSMIDPQLSRFGEICRALEAFPGEFPGAAETAEARTLLADLTARHDATIAKAAEAALAAATSALDGARDAARAGEFARARELVSGRAAWPDGPRADAESFLREIDAAETAAAAERARAEAWAGFAVALRAAGRGGAKEAQAFFDREATRVAALVGREKLARVEARLRDAHRVESLAADGFAAARGVVRVHRGETPVAGAFVRIADGVLRLKPSLGESIDVPLSEIPPRQIAEEAGLIRGELADPMRAAAYCLVRGDLDAARELAALSSSEQADLVRRDIDELASALAPPAAPGPTKEPAGAAATAAATAPPPAAERAAGAGTEDSAAWTKADVFRTELVESDLDAGSLAEFADGETRPGVVQGGTERDRHEPKSFLWTRTTAPQWFGWNFGLSQNPGRRHARFGFTRAIAVGTIVTQARPGVQLSILKPDAAYPGNLASDTEWAAGWRRAEAEVSTWVFPPGTQTRALRLSYDSPETDKEHQGWFGAAYVLTEAFDNCAPEAKPVARTNQPKAGMVVDGSYSIWDWWDNGPEGAPAPVSAATPETISLVWPSKVPLRGICPVRAGLTAADVLVYAGPDDGDPASAPDAEWRRIGSFPAADQYPRLLGVNWMDFGGVVVTKGVRLVITRPEDDSRAHPHMRNRTNDGRRVWLGEFIAMRPVGGSALARLVERMDRLQGRMRADPAVDGYYLTPGVLLNLAKRYDATKVVPKKLAAVGGGAAASPSFDAALRRELVAGDGYLFAGRMGLASAGQTVAETRKSFERPLARERPETVRICFDATDLAKGRTPQDLREDLAAIVGRVFEHGGTPVLFTLPMLRPAAARDAKDAKDAKAPAGANARELVDTYNAMVLDLAAGESLPCVDACGILNADPTILSRYFRPDGRLKDDAFEAINVRFLKAYRVIECGAFGRDVPGLAVAAPATEPAGDRAPPAAPAAPSTGGLVVNGGFEDAGEGGALPTGWNAYPAGGQAHVRADVTNPHGGARALTARALAGAQAGAFTTLVLAPGTYELRYWACADVGATARVQAHLAGTDLAPATVTEEWREVVQTIELEKRAAPASLRIWTSTANVKVWFDDVRVERVP